MTESERKDIPVKEDAVSAVDSSEAEMKTVYPEGGETAVFNPFVEEKKVKPRGILDADYSPDGAVLIEDKTVPKKVAKERENLKKNKLKQEKKREKLLAKIKELEPKLKEIQKQKAASEGTLKFNDYEKKESRLKAKIADLQQRAVSAEQFTPNSGFYIKARYFKMWVVVLVILIVIIVLLSAALISATYRDLAHFRGDSVTQRASVDKLNDILNEEKNSATEEKNSLEEKINNLTEENERLTEKITEYEETHEELQEKADFLDEHIYIVNGGVFKKTYHIYGCSKINYSSFWAYNKEQIDGKMGYSPCSRCIK